VKFLFFRIFQSVVQVQCTQHPSDILHTGLVEPPSFLTMVFVDIPNTGGGTEWLCSTYC